MLECSKCHRSYVNKYTLRRHMESVHDSQEIESDDNLSEKNEIEDTDSEKSENEEIESETGTEKNEAENSDDCSNDESNNESEDSRDKEYTFDDVCAIVNFCCKLNK